MTAGLGICPEPAPLTEAEEEYLERFWAYGLNLTRSDYVNMPEPERTIMADLNATYRLTALMLTRTAMKPSKQPH